MAAPKPACHTRPPPTQSQDPTLCGREAESYINHACIVLRTIYGNTPDNLPDPRICADPLPPLTKKLQGTYFPEPLAARQPTVSWYIANLSYYSRASVGVFTTAISYLERAQPRYKPEPVDPRAAFVAALVLAHRFLEDGSYRTETWARLAGGSTRMISAYVEAMFDALEHRLWIGSLPVSANDKMFSMREGTIFSEEVLGGQRRCSLPSLSVLYGASSASGGRTFGDPQNLPVSTSTAGAGPSTAPATAATAAATVTVPARPVQGLPSPPASPASSAPGTPPQALPLPAARVIKPLPPARRALSMPRAAAPAPKSQSVAGHFNFAEWRAGDAQPFGHSAVSLPPPPPPNPSTQYPHFQPVRTFKPPPVYHLPIPRVVQPSDSPAFDVTQWCAPIPELAEDSTTGADMDISPPHTPADAFMAAPSCGSRPADTFDPRMWAAQVQVDPTSSLVTPAPTVRIGECPEKKLRYPSATLMPSLDPAWNGRRHSIAVTSTRC
ncbi:hypothetical protein BDV93DRAFT_552154 [Ceratobasidium sp. AG-I]|nr:hypothetical protein BDV93DRAFT_552154 [Ceratobasidium sp. AG-I]